MQISAKNLTKAFQHHERKGGVRGSIESLFKRTYQIREAVQGISFDVEAGQTVGYIGPNGAGKSTTIKMLTGVLTPTSGEAYIGGLLVQKNRRALAKRYGVVFGHRTRLWWDLPVIESYELFRDVYEVPPEVYRHNLEMVTDSLDLAKFLKKPVRQLSLGQRVRADLGAALLHSPSVLFLDEPTIGLDLVVKEKVRDLIRTVQRTGQTTILLTTHDLADIEQLCNRIIVINSGRIAYDGGLPALIDEYSPYNVMRIHTKGETAMIGSLARYAERTSKFEGGIEIRFDPKGTEMGEILRDVLAATEILTFEVARPSIEDVVRRLYLRSGSEESFDAASLS